LKAAHLKFSSEMVKELDSIAAKSASHA